MVRTVTVAVVALSVLVALMAVGALRQVHVNTSALGAGIRRGAAVAGVSGGLSRPVVVSSNRLLPQLEYQDFDRYDWVVADPGDLGRYGERLARKGVQHVVLVSTDTAADLQRLPGWKVTHTETGLPLDVTVLSRT
jgi:hypothetical protein